ncbi:hypothetical protein [Clostridium magnum]|uniref:hypothetical protein n=1 Tax=Clostridium magnum TaxID=33954 RepID=UPI0008372334|nr:hypothetical protein [Clostridium magnum]
MEKKKVIRKILRLVYSYDEDFFIEWSKTIRKGFFKYFFKTSIPFCTLYVILGFFFILEKRRFFGFEQGDILPIALIIGIILGVIFSIMSWFLSNRRYDDLKQKKLESENINNNNKKV